MTGYYNTNLQHIQDELKRIDLLLDLQVAVFRQNNKVMNGFQGVYISDEEVNTLLDPINYSDEMDQSINLHKSQLINLESEISKKLIKSLENGVELRISSLANIFDLTPFEIDCIMIGLAPALDRKYEKLYAYLNDDVTRKHPTVDLVLNLLCSSVEDKIQRRRYFDATSNLFKHGLIDFIGEDPGNILSRFIKVDDRIINYITGVDLIDNRIEPYCKLLEPHEDLDGLILAGDLENQINNMIECCKTNKISRSNSIFLFQGPYGAGKKTIAWTICKKLGKKFLTVDLQSLINTETNFEYAIGLIFREVLLQDSAVYIEQLESLYAVDVKTVFYRNILFKNLGYHKGIAFIASRKPVELAEGQNNLLKMNIPVPDYDTRKKMWEKILNGKFSEEDITTISNKFKFTPGQIKDAINSGNKFHEIEGRSNLTKEDVYQGCKEQSSQKLSSLAKKIQPNYKWDDLILPEDKKEQLNELMNYIKNKGVVYQDWGFDARFSLGKGLNVSFSGSSGTGKTMAAEVMASELNLDLYKVDLSMVVSKYIGETEKNLNQIFDAAEESNAILFFDEADALFGKRSEVRDSHDRYANIEISYLLQKMEENQGIVILATNLRQNIDDAFQRRMHFTVEFPFPDENSRNKIWRTLIPQEAPISDDIDFEFLAHNFQLAGGNIKNIIVNAAFYAAGDSGIINMGHMIHGIKREYQKMGKVCSRSDFGDYYELIS